MASVVPYTTRDFKVMKPKEGLEQHTNVYEDVQQKIVTWTYDIKTDQGQRPTQQDTGKVAEIRLAESNSPILLAAVCDGHGKYGDDASKIVIDRLFNIPSEIYDTMGMTICQTPVGISRYLKYAAEIAHNQIRAKTWAPTPADDTGTTMCAAAFVGISSSPQVVISNIGDSQALLINNNGGVKLFTAPHKPESDTTPDLDKKKCAPHKATRIQDPDGGTMNLGVSRSIGHTHLADLCGVLPRPSVYVQPIESGDILLIGSDGLWDFYNKVVGINVLALELAEAPKETFDSLINMIKKDGRFKDNVTAIMIIIDVTVPI